MQFSAFGVLMMMLVKHFASNRVAEVVQAGFIQNIGLPLNKKLSVKYCIGKQQGIFETRILDTLHKYFCNF